MLADGSTDWSTVEEDIVYVHYVSCGKPKVKFLNMLELEHADAAGVLHALIQTLDEIQLNEERRLEKLVGINLDGASLNRGRYTDVVALKKPIYCCYSPRCSQHGALLLWMH